MSGNVLGECEELILTDGVNRGGEPLGLLGSEKDSVVVEDKLFDLPLLDCLHET